MTFAEFESIVESQPDGVILLEGRRDIPASDYQQATSLAHKLATMFPRLRFRSGNAEGSDQAFSDGVAAVDAGRLQIIAPYETHRKKFRYPEATYGSPASLSTTVEDEIAYKTTHATPKNERLIKHWGGKGRMAVYAAYLIRDTMKVTGFAPDFIKPICGIFYVDPEDPMKGGTGHTVRVCELEGVPVAFQDAWQNWL